MTYTCPVCGYDGLVEPPAEFEICTSCGTEFENDDYLVSHAELRARWIADGAQWWSSSTPQPAGWSAVRQLQRLGYQPTHYDLAAIADAGKATTGTMDLSWFEFNVIVALSAGAAPIDISIRPNVATTTVPFLATGRQERARFQRA